jgi:hypothetical protein
MLLDSGLRQIMHGTPTGGSAGYMHLLIFSGTVPATADATLSGNTLLCTIITNANTEDSLEFANTSANGVISKHSDVWMGTNVASGTATFFRLVGNSDTLGAASSNATTPGTTKYIIQGTIGTSGADLNLVSTSLVEAQTQTIEYFVLSFPTD